MLTKRAIHVRWRPTIGTRNTVRFGLAVVIGWMAMISQNVWAVDQWQIWEPTEPTWKLIGKDPEKAELYVDTKNIDKSELEAPGKFVWAFVQFVYPLPHTKFEPNRASPLVREVSHIKFSCRDKYSKVTNWTNWYEAGENSRSPMPMLSQIREFRIQPKTVYADILTFVCAGAIFNQSANSSPPAAAAATQYDTKPPQTAREFLLSGGRH